MGEDAAGEEGRVVVQGRSSGGELLENSSQVLEKDMELGLCSKVAEK